MLLLGSSCVVGAPAGGMLGAKHRSNGACAGSLLRCAKRPKAPWGVLMIIIMLKYVSVLLLTFEYVAV